MLAFRECMIRMAQRGARVFFPVKRESTKDKIELLMEDYNISGQMNRKYQYTNRTRFGKLLS
mgnify:CR=1 FL=1